jgi:hypothetical protein
MREMSRRQMAMAGGHQGLLYFLLLGAKGPQVGLEVNDRDDRVRRGMIDNRAGEALKLCLGTV